MSISNITKWRIPILRSHRLLSTSSSSSSSSSSSINPDEVAKFSAVGKDWWDSESKSGVGPLHHMNATRIDFVRRNLAKAYGRESLPILEQLKGLKILDVGCGGGLAAEALARLGAEVTAVDPSAKNIEIAQFHSAMDPTTAKIKYVHTTVESIAASGDKFDAVCALEVIGMCISRSSNLLLTL